VDRYRLHQRVKVGRKNRRVVGTMNIQLLIHFFLFVRGKGCYWIYIYGNTGYGFGQDGGSAPVSSPCIFTWICDGYVRMRKQARPLFTHPPQSPGPYSVSSGEQTTSGGDIRSLLTNSSGRKKLLMGSRKAASNHGTLKTDSKTKQP